MLARIRRRLRLALQPANPPMFAGVEAFCLFIGYPRSGHSLIGSALDAHPQVVIAHEADALKLAVGFGYSRKRLYDALVENARRQAEQESGRMQSGYAYTVPGQWQGRFDRLRVIGDKGGGESARRLAADPSELRKLTAKLGVPVRVLHITRNPFDVVARLSRVTKDEVPKQTLDEALTRFEVLAVVNDAVVRSGEFVVLTLSHESFVAHPKEELARICEFVGVAADEDYLEACAGIVWDSPHRTRELVEWSDEQVQRLERIIERYPFLSDYRFVDA